MMRLLSLLIVTLAAIPMAARADPLRYYASEDPNPHSGRIGIHLDRSSEAGAPHGISMDLDGAPVWDIFAPDVEWQDLILAYSHTLRSPVLRMRADTAQMELGQMTRRTTGPFQMHLIAGNPREPLGALGIAMYGDQPGLYLYNTKPGARRTNLNFFNLFAWGTDSTDNGATDFWLQNYLTRTRPIVVSRDDQISLAGELAHSGERVGFLGAAPVAKPAVTGSRQDGSALSQLLSQLGRLGLVEDASSP